jgi:hypothetical protein
MNRHLRGPRGLIVIFLLMTIFVIAILAFAHAFAILDADKRCFPGFVHAQWPKWIGCAMAAHENLAGGLIAAAGALLAAIIAADAVWQQIRDARDQVAIAESRQHARETFSFRRVVEYYSRLLRPFDQAEGGEDIKYVNGLNALFKTGNLVPFFGSLPDHEQHLARDAWERLSNLNYALGELQKQIGNSGAIDTRSRAEINAGIREVVKSMHEFRASAEKELIYRPV